MSYYTRKQPGGDANPDNPPHGQNTQCPPTSDPADQPKDPDCNCAEPQTPQAPPDVKAEKCPDPSCDCPPAPVSTSDCLEKLITAQAAELAKAERTKVFKADLEALLAKAKAAKQDYSTDKYGKLLDEWKKQDAQIFDLIRKLDCAVPCWWCVIECHICPLLYEIRYREQELYGDGTLPAAANNLYDVRYWHERNLDQQKRAFERVKNALAAWEKPAQTIEKVLADNAKLIADASKFLAPDAPKLVFDVFLRLVPMHLAIAPPASTAKTAIAKKYTKFCECDKGTPDPCCGLDLGVRSVRERLTGPQPYLLHPNVYFDLICCLVEKRYMRAKQSLGDAEAAFQTADANVKRHVAEIEERMKSFEKDARGAIPNDVKCCAEKPDPNHQPSGATAS
jgi:hypothetical protein